MDNEVKVTNIKSLIITITLVVLIITAGTFAWLSYRSKSTAMVLTIGDINDIQITLKPYELDLELSPILTYTSLDANEEYVTVSVVNNSSEDQNFNLYYDIKHIDSSLISSDFKWTLLRTTDNNVTSGNFSSASTSSNLYILKDFSIPANTTWNYRVYTWVDGTNNPNISNALFEANLQAKLLGVHIPLPDFITTGAVMDNINSTYVHNSTPGINFGAISSNTNGKGIYIRSGTENDAYPIYYYRGAVDNNNLLFANKCWKIVRTTETGGIKLLYNGVPSNGQCNNTSSSATTLPNTTKYNDVDDDFDIIYDADLIGYMYDNNTTSSLIKTVIDTWYASNLISYTNMLEDTVWCNDRADGASGFTSQELQEVQNGVVDSVFAPTYRVRKLLIPSLSCTNSDDRFTVSSNNGNGALTYPIALLTSDEIMLAGSVYGSSNHTVYFYNGGSWWTMSPLGLVYEYNTPIIWVFSGGQLYDDGLAGYSEAVRPSISLKPGLTYSGSGTTSNPYVVIQ